MIDDNMSKDEAITFFRGYIAKRDGISEEEAGRKINKAVDLGLGLLEPITELTKKIKKISEKSTKDGFKMTKTVIAQLLSPIPLKLRKLILIELLLDGGDDEKMKKEMGFSLDEYLQNKLK